MDFWVDMSTSLVRELYVQQIIDIQGRRQWSAERRVASHDHGEPISGP